MEKAELMQWSFMICIGIAVLLFIVSIILFVKLDIRSIFAARSVRNNAQTDRMADAAQTPAPIPAQKPFGRRRTTPSEGAERTVVLNAADGAAGTEMTAVLPPINELSAQNGDFTIVKKVICTDSAETIV